MPALISKGLRNSSAAVVALALATCIGSVSAHAQRGAGIAAGVAAGVLLGAVVAGAAANRARAAAPPRQRSVRRTTTRSRSATARRQGSNGEASNNAMVPSERGKAIPASQASADPFAQSRQVRQSGN